MNRPNENKRNTGTLTRFVKILIFMLCCAVFFLLTGCLSGLLKGNSLTQTREQPYRLSLDSQGQVNDVSLLTALVEGINQTTEMRLIFQGIPQALREDLSLDDFAQYVQALIRPDNQPVIEFYRLPLARKQQLVTQLTSHLTHLAAEAGSSEYYELVYQKDDGPKNQTIIAIQHDANGQAYLSSAWIREANKLYQFTRLYFTAIENNDRETLSWLLLQGERSAERHELKQIEDQKSELLIRYYSQQINAKPTQSPMSMLLPNRVDFKQAVHGSGPDPSEERICSFSQTADRIMVSEPYPEEIKINHLNVYKNDQYLFSWVNNGVRLAYTNEAFDAVLGRSNIYLITDQSSPQTENKLWRVRYPGVEFVIDGQADPKERTWSGKIDQMELSETSNKVSLGMQEAKDALYPGMSLVELYSQYPFSRESRFIIEGNQEGERMTLSIQVGQDQVKRLVLKANQN